jgi:predicted CoA-binding protein
MEVVAVIGASNDPSRYSFKAMEMLGEYGHEAIPVHPREEIVLGKRVFSSIGELAKSHKQVDTVTIYVNQEISRKYEADLIKLRPKRVIFNPGAENPALAKALTSEGIKVENACTLVMLRTNQF